MMARAAATGLLCLVLLPRPALAQQGPADSGSSGHVRLPGFDGVYGRFDGSLGWALSAGAELEGDAARGALRVSAHYLWTSGVYARYSDAFGGKQRRALRAFSLGVDLRPLFLPRFALDAQQGPAVLDLTLDSLALTAGAYFAEPRNESFGAERGFEAGLGLGFPLFSEARGLWLEARVERRIPDRGDAAWLMSAWLAWHGITWTTEERR